MAKENQCPHCGGDLPPDAPQGICPKCLMKAGLARDPSVTLDTSPLIEGPGTKIGHYELLELIGEGGMGLVYLAEQKEPVRRKVVLKIVKPGMDSKQVIARFEAERQALAVLDHPNIAHVFDAGATAGGRPYFVMEYVKGMSITRYCDDKKLNIEQRLRLFEQVCEGVHHAHQKGIIHRDLKPSNILVSVHGDRAVPKIIDFGIAKAITQPLTDKTFVTFQGQLLGTPEYMSPEQVDLATQDIDTRSDIYSLGVVLYELLAGVLPFEEESFARAGFAEIQRTIREQEPASPSMRLTSLGEKAKTIATSRGTQVLPLARRLHRELEWVPLKAMRKDRCRRYRSAFEMADDIHNYLSGRPLIAGPETAIYRVQKFVCKHAGSVATVALVALAIVLGLVVSTVMYLRAEDARQKEAAARVQAEQANTKEAIARTEAERAKNAEQEQRKLAEKQAEDLRRTMYVNNIQLADSKYRQGNIGRVRELLDDCPNDLRGWEWARINYVADESDKTLIGHETYVMCVALSPDGKLAASGDDGGTIRLWDWKAGIELASFSASQSDVHSLAFSPDGKYLVTAGSDKLVRLWDLAKRKVTTTFRGHQDTIYSVVFSPDGSRLATASDDGTIRIWNLSNADEVRTVRLGHRGVRSAAFSPDGKRIASGCDDGTVVVWDAATGRTLTVSKGYNDGTCVSFSPDGDHIASSSNTTVKLWNAATGEEEMTVSFRQA
jgi:serine/threonine protein kinase